MVFAYFNRVKETSSTTGTGNITLGGAPTGFRTFSSVYSSGDTFYYEIADQSGPNFEQGIGTFTGGVLVRTTVLDSTNSNALVNFTSGALSVFVTNPADGMPTASGKTGTGTLVLANSPRLIAPDIGAATGINIRLVNGSGTLSTGNNCTVESIFGTTNGTVSALYDASLTTPSTVTNPAVYIQRHVKKDLGFQTAQTVGGLYLDLETYGSGTTTPFKGCFLGGLVSVTNNNTNRGSSAVPNYDQQGSTVGFAAFAASTGAFSDGDILTGLWGYAYGPSIDDTTYANLPAANWGYAGLEVNVSYFHPDPGVQNYLVGKGCSTGILINNYRASGTGVRDWTFGITFNGTPQDGNYFNTNVDQWNGFHTGILLDKIKDYGIQFGGYQKSTSYGIWFPATFIGTQEPAAGIFMGGAKLNIGTYSGSNFYEGDIWQSGGIIYYRHSGVSQQIYPSTVAPSGIISAISIDFSGSNVPANGMYQSAANTLTITSRGILCHAFVNPASPVNYLASVGGATGVDPYFTSGGSDTNVGLSFKTQGTGTLKLFTNNSARQAEFLHTASTTNWLTFTGSNGGNPTINVSGGSLAITPATIFNSTITLNGSTSGTSVLKAPAIAGAGIVFALPSSNGSSGYILQTDGAGVTSWVANSAGSAAFSAITGSTNTTAAMVVGTGASLAASGSGTITATAVPASGITGSTLASGVTASSITSFGASIVLGTPASGTLTNCTFPTLNQNTTGSAASVSISGQTGLLTFTGLASTARIKTVRDAADTLLELGGNYTPTGTWTNLALVTPALGTPASGVLTNCTGTAAGLTAGAVSTINSLIAQGSNVTITGSGTSGSPYVINSSGSGSVTTTYFGSLVFANTSIPAALTSTTETAFDTTKASYTIAANSLNAGDVVRIRLAGIYSGTVLPTVRGKVKWGSTIMMDTGATTGLVSGTNLGWTSFADFIVQTNGASGAIESQGYAEFSTAATTSLTVNTPNSSAITIDTTTSQQITVTIQWGAGGTGQTITLREMTVDILRNNSGSANTVQNGGTALSSLTAHAVMLGEGTSAVGFATIGTAGRLLIDQGASADPSFQVVSGDITITSGGVTTLKTSPSITTPNLIGLPTGTGVASGATVSTLASRDVNGNTAFNNVLEGYTTTATAAGTTTLTVSSTYSQYFTGSTTQTVVLPVASTLVLNQAFAIVNNSTGTVTVNSSGSNLVVSIPGGQQATVTCILTSGTSAASWSVNLGSLTTSGTGAYILATAPTIIAPYISQINAPTSAGVAIAGRTDGVSPTSGNIGEVLTYGNIIATSTVTITNASPAVVTYTAHGMTTGMALYLTTTGALPTGLSQLVTYYVIVIDPNTLWLATTGANAQAGTKINTSSAGSGTHTAIKGAWMATGTVSDVMAISIPAGGWVLQATCRFSNGTTTFTTIQGVISTSSGSGVSTTKPGYFAEIGCAYTGDVSRPTSNYYLNSSVATTVYVSMKVAFASNNCTCGAILTAQRYV